MKNKKLQKAFLATLLALMAPHTAHAWTWSGLFYSTLNSIKQTSLQTKVLFAGAAATVGGVFGLWNLHKKSQLAETKRQIDRKKHQQQKIKIELVQEIFKRDQKQLKTKLSRVINECIKKIKKQKNKKAIGTIKKYKNQKIDQLQTEAITTILANLRRKSAQNNLHNELVRADKIGVVIAGDGNKDNETIKLNLFPSYREIPQHPRRFDLNLINNQAFHEKTVAYGFVPLKKKFLDQFFPQNTKDDKTDCGRVQGMFRYTSKKYDPKSKKKGAVFFVVHGTFANDSPHYRDPKTDTFNKMLKFAQEWANKHNIPVDVISYHWDGWNAGESRENGGTYLAKMIDAFSPWYSFVGAIGHSHGTNVINVATNHCKRTVDLLIYCASPVRENNDKSLYKPKNFKLLLNCFSLHDLIQYIGAFTKEDSYWSPLKTAWNTIASPAITIAKLAGWSKKQEVIPDGRTYDQQKNKEVYNIVVKKDNIRPGHSGVPAAVMGDMLEIHDKVVDMKNQIFRYPKNVVQKIKKFVKQTRIHLEVNVVPKEKTENKRKNKILINIPKLKYEHQKDLTQSLNEIINTNRKEHKRIYREDMNKKEWRIYVTAMLVAKANS